MTDEEQRCPFHGGDRSKGCPHCDLLSGSKQNGRVEITDFEKVVLALEKLSLQVKMSNAVDDHGHDIENLQALIDADELLEKFRK